MDRAACQAAYDARLEELGEVTFTRIEVEPFAINRFGTTFGLIPRELEEDDDVWWVTLEPGDYMPSPNHGTAASTTPDAYSRRCT
jgi:hypothetical protein